MSNMKEELVKLYKEYCDYIDSDNDHYDMHDSWKNTLSIFMRWLSGEELFK